MSCGNPHEIDCRDVLDKVYFFLDREQLSADELAKIQEHLHECSPCLSKYDLEVHVRKLVARACQDEAPNGLRIKVLAQIQAIRDEQDGTGSATVG